MKYVHYVYDSNPTMATTCGYLLFTNFSFDGDKSKDDVCRGVFIMFMSVVNCSGMMRDMNTVPIIQEF